MLARLETAILAALAALVVAALGLGLFATALDLLSFFGVPRHG